ncbi:alpha-amylase family glycosyl hydrolase [Flavobacterium hauense]
MLRSIVLAISVLCITPAFAQHEVMYHISTRSFFDSNGDGQGDLTGILQKLDYLQQFGVTTISLSPIYQSDFYHNLYAVDLEKTDGEYGNFKEYRDLIQNIHLRKMKMYQEVDLQYVGAKHLWFTDSFKNTKSLYSSYIYYTDPKNEKPFLLPEITTYNGAKEQVAAVNLKNAKVAAYYSKALKYWADPNGDGNFNDGVDGFRIVDVKDKLDNSGKTSNQLKEFYAPLIAGLKKVNPALQFLAEATSVNFGNDLYAKAGFDRVSSMKLRDAIVSFDKKKIMTAVDSTYSTLGAGKIPVPFIENENTQRIASLPTMNLGKLKLAAGLSFLLGGVPCMYYGQEIGMMGKPLNTGTDGDGIPSREAFEWYASNEGQGMATWYKDAGQYWENRSAADSDGVSLEEQQKNTESLWGYYKQLIRMKKMQPAVAEGKYEKLLNNNDNVVSFVRDDGKNKVLVMINLSGKEEFTRIDDASILRLDDMKLIFGSPNVDFGGGARGITLSPYCVQVWKCFY